MSSHGQTYSIAFLTILRKEIRRFARIWIQTVFPPVITTALYFLIFGKMIGSQLAPIDGYAYIDYIVPGLIMMGVLTNSYGNVVSSFYGAKFGHYVEEMMIAPIPHSLILLGYVAGGVARGLVVGIIVTVVAAFFTDIHLHNLWVALSVMILTAIMFSLGGFINAVYANSFDDISIIPTFVLTPLTYLGGVFYSIQLLPGIWQDISMFNPILYIVNAFRYGLLGVSDIDLSIAYSIIILFIAVLYGFSLYLLKKGIGIRT